MTVDCLDRTWEALVEDVNGERHTVELPAPSRRVFEDRLDDLLRGIECEVVEVRETTGEDI